MLEVVGFGEFMSSYEKGSGEDVSPEEEKVREIIGQVRRRGDEALRELSLLYDGVDLPALEVGQEEIARAAGQVDEAFLLALRESRERIEAFCRQNIPQSWFYTGDFGEVLGQKVTALDRVGIYIPGGSAPYPSSVLMTAVPARVAGVKEICICSPPEPDGGVNPRVLAAAAEAGVNRVFPVGGAQAVAAMAYGTSSIPPVDKICGPGNLYVTLAKKLVFGRVGIDMLAGPSEVLIIAGEKATPAFVAADLLAQGEHGPTSACYLVSFSRKKLEDIFMELETQLAGLPRRALAARALKRGKAVLVDGEEEAFMVANRVAPEHLQVFLEDPWKYLDMVRNAGAVCLGEYTPAAVGDYWAGPSHVLPTGGSARFFSPLGVEDFTKRSSVLAFTRDSLARAREKTVCLAREEGFEAHARALSIREGNDDEP